MQTPNERPFTIADYKLFVMADFYHRWSLINEKDSLLSITTLEHGSKHIKSFDPDHFEDIPDYLDQKLNLIKEEITKLSVPIGRFVKPIKITSAYRLDRTPPDKHSIFADYSGVSLADGYS